MLNIGALVAYRSTPAKIISIQQNKFEILLPDSKIIKVREKDFLYIYPQYEIVKDLLVDVNAKILLEFEGQLLSIKEVTEWIFEVYNAQNAWQTYLLAKDGLYFYINGSKLFIRDAKQLNKIKQQRQDKLIELTKINSCIENINNNKISAQDDELLQELELVAYNLVKYSKLLNHLKIKSTPESAHKFLLDCGYWDALHNPYPNRNSIHKNSEHHHTFIDSKREDLTHLTAYAIDNKSSNDADDAISIDGDTIWIHIADVATQISIDSDLDNYAKNHISSLYLPDMVINMLPDNVLPIFSLGAKKYSQAMSIGFQLNKGEIFDIKIVKSNIQVKNISYDDADEILSENSDLKKLNNIAKQHSEFRNNNGAIRLELANINIKLLDKKVFIQEPKFSKSREMVAEMMIIAGRVCAKFALENNIPMPYLTQEKGDFSKDILANKNNLSFSQKFSMMRCFKKSKISSIASAHYALGLDAYIRITSPIRRYLDLVAQQQIINFINNKSVRTKEQIMQTIRCYNKDILKIIITNKHSLEHFKCLFLQQNKNWQGIAIVVAKKDSKAILFIKSLSIFTTIKLDDKFSLDEEVKIKVKSIDLVNLLVEFKLA